MSNIRISQLNSLLVPTTDDFIPIVDSASLTTYRTPITSLLTVVAQIGSVPSASWASASISSSQSETASFAWDYSRVKSVTKYLYNTNSYSQDMAHVYNVPTGGYIPGFHNLLVSMKCWGDVTRTAKIYLITCDNYSPGMVVDPVTAVTLDGTAYNGWYIARPLSATRNYSPGSPYNTDYHLEMSQSYALYVNNLYFRIRCQVEVPPSAIQKVLGILSFWSLDVGSNIYSNFNVEAMADNKTLVVPSNEPSWPNAFVEIKNKMMTVSGSLVVEKPITGSLNGTASWALNIPGTSFVTAGGSYNISCSWASSSLSSSLTISSSYAVTSSYSVTASYAQMAKSSSFAKTAETASYITASVLTSGIPGIIKAWAQCACTSSMPGNSIQGTPGLNANVMALVSSNNVSSVIRTMGVIPKDRSNNGQDYIGDSTNKHWIVTMTNPMPSTNYTVMGAGGGEPGTEWNIVTIYPFASKTTTAFTLSMAGGTSDFYGDAEITWFNFMVVGV